MDNPAFLISIAIVILGALAFGWMIYQGNKAAAAQRAREARAARASASILQIGKSSPRPRQGSTVVKLRLEVHPPAAEAYQVSTVWDVQQANLSQIQPGQKVSVKIDAEDAQRVYPNESWASFAPMHWEAWVKDKQKKSQGR